jgi:glycolate oxidase
VKTILAARIRPSLLELMDSATLRAIDDWKSTGFGDGVQALLIAHDDSESADRSAELMREICAEAGASLAEVATSEAESRQLLELRQLAYPAIERLGVALVEDICVPRTMLPDMVARIDQAAQRHSVFIATVAHAGDGNLHPVFVFERGLPEVPPAIWSAADEVFRAALELGGTLTSEHGVGMIKRRWLGDELGAESMAVHDAIKHALDPEGIMNPGKAI